MDATEDVLVAAVTVSGCRGRRVVARRGLGSERGQVGGLMTFAAVALPYVTSATVPGHLPHSCHHLSPSLPPPVNGQSHPPRLPPSHAPALVTSLLPLSSVTCVVSLFSLSLLLPLPLWFVTAAFVLSVSYTVTFALTV